MQQVMWRKVDIYFDIQDDVYFYKTIFSSFYILSEEAISDRSLSALLQNGCEALQNPEAALHAQYFRFRISDD